LSKWGNLPWAIPHDQNNVKFIGCALGDKKDIRTYYEFDDASWNSLLSEEAPRRVTLNKLNERYVVVTTLDNSIKEDNIGMLKIDAEGFDYNILVGGQNLINKNKPTILIEVPNDVESKQRIIDLLSKYGYDAYGLGWRIEDNTDIEKPFLNMLFLQSDNDAVDRIIKTHNEFVDLYELMEVYNYNHSLSWMNNRMRILTQ
jgi:FkbM family methyltransferase